MFQNNPHTRESRDDQEIPQGVPVARPPRILIAEDDDEMRRLLAQTLSTAGYEVVSCSNGFEFISHLEPLILEHILPDFQLIVSDILMPALTGLEILEDLHAYRGFPPMILITAFGDQATHEKARQWGAVAVFDKPFEMQDLLAKVRDIVPLHSV
jgi:CheY-like chemotaxis protein